MDERLENFLVVCAEFLLFYLVFRLSDHFVLPQYRRLISFPSSLQFHPKLGFLISFLFNFLLGLITYTFGTPNNQELMNNSNLFLPLLNLCHVCSCVFAIGIFLDLLLYCAITEQIGGNRVDCTENKQAFSIAIPILALVYNMVTGVAQNQAWILTSMTCATVVLSFPVLINAEALNARFLAARLESGGGGIGPGRIEMMDLDDEQDYDQYIRRRQTIFQEGRERVVDNSTRSLDSTLEQDSDREGDGSGIDDEQDVAENDAATKKRDGGPRSNGCRLSRGVSEMTLVGTSSGSGIESENDENNRKKKPEFQNISGDINNNTLNTEGNSLNNISSNPNTGAILDNRHSNNNDNKTRAVARAGRRRLPADIAIPIAIPLAIEFNFDIDGNNNNRNDNTDNGNGINFNPDF